MRKVTVILTAFEYAKMMAFLAATDSTLRDEIRVFVETSEFEITEEVKLKYNNAFIKALAKCNLSLTEEAEKKYLL